MNHSTEDPLEKWRWKHPSDSNKESNSNKKSNSSKESSSNKAFDSMADQDPPRRYSTTPIPVPVVPGSFQTAPTPSPLSQTPVSSNDRPAATSAPATSTTVPMAAHGEAIASNPVDKDVTMTDAGADDQAASPAAPGAGNAPAAAADKASPATGRTSTPLRTNGQVESSSRAASQHPESGFSLPAEAPAHGAPIRQYLNSTVARSITDGLKILARDRPQDPLRVLGEFLLQRSRELES